MFHVVDRDVKTILGLTDTMKLNLIQLDAEVHSIVNPVIDDYSDLFDDTVLDWLAPHLKSGSVLDNQCYPYI